MKLQGLKDRLPLPEVPHGEHALVETIWILAASVVCVPVVCSIPGGSAVLGFLVRACHSSGTQILPLSVKTSRRSLGSLGSRACTPCKHPELGRWQLSPWQTVAAGSCPHSPSMQHQCLISSASA